MILSEERIAMHKSFMERIAGFIVDKRFLFLLIFAGLCILSIFTSNSVRVDEDLTDYLPDDSETRQGLAIMEREFITHGDARVMVSNILKSSAPMLTAVRTAAVIAVLRPLFITWPS